MHIPSGISILNCIICTIQVKNFKISPNYGNKTLQKQSQVTDKLSEKTALFTIHQKASPLNEVILSHTPMNTAKAASNAEVQAYLDEVTSLGLSDKYNDWYQVDVSAMLKDCKILSHEVDALTGDSLVFLKSSLLFCSPELGVMRHYPRSLVHCFVEDKRTKKGDDNLLFRGELFSVTPESEQLCWVRDCTQNHEIPSTQSLISGWMKWLNQE